MDTVIKNLSRGPGRAGRDFYDIFGRLEDSVKYIMLTGFQVAIFVTPEATQIKVVRKDNKEFIIFENGEKVGTFNNEESTIELDSNFNEYIELFAPFYCK